MKVLLTGATGFLGGEIARRLIAAGHDVRITVRKSSKLDGVKDLPLEKVEADILDKASMVRALEGRDALIHAAASVSSRVRDKDAIFRANVEGTRAVLEAAVEAKVSRVVYTSTIGTIGTTEDAGLHDERTVWDVERLDYGYVNAKKKAEELAFDFARRGLPLVILNPGFILGPGDVYGSSTRVVSEWLHGRLSVYLEGGLSFCDVRDVAQAHVDALTKGTVGERYIVAGQNLRWSEFYTAAARLSGVPMPVRAPYALAYSLGFVFEMAAKLFEHRFEELNRPVVRFGGRFNFCDVSKAKAALGYTVTPFEETIRDTLADLVRQGKAPALTPALSALAASAKLAAESRKPARELVGAAS